MKESELVLAFKNYQWPEIWENVKNENVDTLKKHFKALLLIAWWQEPEESKALLINMQCKETPLVLFLTALTYLCLGERRSFAVFVEKLKATPHPKWMVEWLTIEFNGRTRNFDGLLKALKTCSAKNETWPYVAALQCLDQEISNTDKISNFLDSQKNLPMMGRALQARLNPKNLEKYESYFQSSLDTPAVDIFTLVKATTSLAQGDTHKALTLFDILARKAFLDKPIANEWLGLSLSSPLGWEDLDARIQHVLQIAPNSDRSTGQIYTFKLIKCWVIGDYVGAYHIIRKFHGFLSMTEYDSSTNATEKNNRVFFLYVLSLATQWQLAPEKYNAMPLKEKLFVFGESHSLSPANRVFALCGSQVQASANFVFGVKMHHLAQESNNIYRSCMDQHISRLGTGSNCLFTIGEIDCRPDEGIWSAVKKHNKNMEDVIHATVSGYINYIKNRLLEKEARLVIIQGVPAPGYSLSSKMPLEEEALFLDMVKCVNKKLKSESLRAGFAFFDVYTATVGANNFSNNKLHIDEYHLKPSIYDTLDQWLVLP